MLEFFCTDSLLKVENDIFYAHYFITSDFDYWYSQLFISIFRKGCNLYKSLCLNDTLGDWNSYYITKDVFVRPIRLKYFFCIVV